LAQTAAPIPAEPPAVTTPAGAPATVQVPPRASAAEPVAKDPGATPKLVTPEQVYTAMIEAEKRRAQAMRPDPSVPKSVGEKWGVEVIRVDNTADGFWLDFRFRVTDADKALPLFDSKIKPYLESEKSGVKLAVPSAAKVGALRTTNRGHNVKSGKIYNIMFANPGYHVKQGQKVSIVIGDFKVEHLTVH
jgi:hypothetical protein